MSNAEGVARATYNRIAAKYYTPAHPTSNAFDNSIRSYLEKQSSILNRTGVHLDAGCGRSKLFDIPFLGTAVLLDLSLEMLLQSSKAKSCDRVIGSALRLPIASESIIGVYSFLGDAFGYEEFFEEAFRVLKRGGILLEIVPTRLWALTLRKKLGIPSNVTYFLDENVKLFAPSLSFNGDELADMLESVGFTAVRWESIFLPSDFPRLIIPEHIQIPADTLQIDPYALPLLIAAYAAK